MIVIAVIIALLLLAVVMSPFFVKESRVLSHGSSINSPETLRSLKDQLVRRLVEEEEAHRSGSLSDGAWNKRRQFLVNRYIDAARRLDFLEKVAKHTPEADKGKDT